MGNREYRKRPALMFVAGIALASVVIPGIAAANNHPAIKEGPADPVALVAPLPVPVDVTNMPAATVRTPVALYAQATADGGIVSSVDLRVPPSGEVFVVPDGKQLVVEHISMAPVGAVASGEVVNGVLFDGASRYSAGQLTAENGQSVFFPGSGELMNVRIGPGGEPRVGAASVGYSGLINFTASGYLEPAG